MAHVLVVEDEPDIAELVRYTLEQHGYTAACAASGEEALASLRTRLPDLIVLDLMLPGMDGLEVCRLLKHDARTANLPIVMLTARDSEADVVVGLELGADDYLTKPFSPRVLVARIKAVLRRRQVPSPAENEVIVRDQLVIHPGRHQVLVAGQVAALTPTEFRILHLLARRPGWVFTRAQIVARVQGEEAAVTERAVDVHIVALRRKLGPCAGLIETIRGVGYRFKAPED
ncbi:MAG: DNA-binding response regulator [Candidatus Tectimicrobiota bacterium]|nr:MAG: DNA-binding response regulator [Candidatus Tectomicrobia bacterium]